MGRTVLRAIRRRMAPELRSKFDSTEFTQLVWCRFFQSLPQLQDLSEPKQLVGLLTTIARNAMVEEHRRLHTRKYALQQEQSLDELTGSLSGEFKSRDPSPSQLAIAREQWDQLLAQQQDPRNQRILQLRLFGKTKRSIAQELGISPKTVQRVLDRATPETE